MNFQTIWIPQGMLAKFLSEKSWSCETVLSKALEYCLKIQNKRLQRSTKHTVL